MKLDIILLVASAFLLGTIITIIIRVASVAPIYYGALWP